MVERRRLASRIKVSLCLLTTMAYCGAPAAFSLADDKTQPGDKPQAGDTAPAGAGTDADKTPAPDRAEAKPAVNINRQLQAAGDCMVDGRYADAADIFKQALSLVPDNVEAMAGLGMALGRQNKLDEADEQFDKVLTINPNNAVAHCGKAMVLLNRYSNAKDNSGKPRAQLLKEAGRECNKALDADPRVVEAHYLLGKVYREENRLDRAEQAFSGAVKLDPHYSGAWVALGMVQTQREKYGPSLESFNQAISVSPNNATAYFGRGQLYAKQGQTDRAVKEYNMSLYKNPNNPAVHLALGKAMDQQGDSIAAVKEFQEAIKLKPEDPEPYVELANDYESRGELDNSIAKLRSGLKIMPNEPSLRMMVGSANMRAGRLDEAIADYLNVLSVQPKSTDAAQGLVRALFVKSQREPGIIIERTGDFQRARTLIGQVVEGNPDSLVARYAAAELAAIAGETPALDSIGVPKTDADRLALAEANLAQYKYAEADELFKRAVYNATKAKDCFAIADLAYSLRALDAAETAFRKGLTFVNSDARARKGLDAVTTARQTAQQDFQQADELYKHRMFDQATTKYFSAVFGDPRNIDARLGLAQSLEKLPASQAGPNGRAYRMALLEYKLYLKMAPPYAVRDVQKYNRKIARLDELVRKSEGTAPAPPGRSSSDRVSASSR
jgi:tetratricopeptide (TPR) repeat protein